MTPRQLIFDFNGVILHDEPLHLEATRLAFAELGATMSDEQFMRHCLGVPDHEGMPHLAEALGLSEHFDAVLARKNAVYEARLAEAPPVAPDLDSLLPTLAQRFPMVVVSGAERREIEAVLGPSGLLECFLAVVAVEDVERPKPHPEGYLRGLAALPGDEASETLVIEDAPAGIRAAKAAGMMCVAVATSAPSWRLAEADRVFGDFEALRRFLLELG